MFYSIYPTELVDLSPKAGFMKFLKKASLNLSSYILIGKMATLTKSSDFEMKREKAKEEVLLFSVDHDMRGYLYNGDKNPTFKENSEIGYNEINC